ncbi:MAG: hypothetical protein AB7I59_16085 [Geminicoccaceae bacterium]
MTDDGTGPAGTPNAAGEPEQGQAGVADELRGASHDVSREAQAAGHALRQQASGLAGTIRQGMSEQAARQKNGIADRLGAVAERAQRTAGDLRQDEPWLGNLLERGADELAGMAEELRRQDVADLMGSVEVFARRQPALFMGASVALGFALTRVVGAGSSGGDYREERYRRDLPTRYDEDLYSHRPAGEFESRRGTSPVTQPTQSATQPGQTVTQPGQTARPSPATTSGSNI